MKTGLVAHWFNEDPSVVVSTLNLQCSFSLGFVGFHLCDFGFCDIDAFLFIFILTNQSLSPFLNKTTGEGGGGATVTGEKSVENHSENHGDINVEIPSNVAQPVGEIITPDLLHGQCTWC